MSSPMLLLVGLLEQRRMSWGTRMSMAMLGGTLAPNSSASLLLAFGAQFCGAGWEHSYAGTFLSVQLSACSAVPCSGRYRAEELSHIELPHHFVAFQASSASC